MSTIVNLPVLYAVDGVLTGKRRREIHKVVESVPFEIGEMDGIVEEADFLGLRGLVWDGRPWLPVLGDIDVRGSSGMSLLNSQMAGRLVHDPMGSPEAPMAPLVGRPWRRLARMAQVVVVPEGSDWRSRFRSIDADDRTAAVEVSRRVADRLRFLDGRLHTDRYEPLRHVSRDPNVDPPVHLVYDVVLGDELVCRPASSGADRLLGFEVRWKGSESTPGAIPREEAWFDLIRSEVEPGTPVMLWLARKLSHLSSPHYVFSSAAQEAIGYRAVAEISTLVHRGRHLDGRPFEQPTVQEVRSSIASIRLAMTHADPFDASEWIEAADRSLDIAEASLERALVHDRANDWIAPEDADALAMLATFRSPTA